MTKPSLTALIAYVMFGLSLALAGGSLYSIMRIDVLVDWRLTLPDQTIHAGDTIIVKSEYTKLREVDGVAKRYIDCDTKNGVNLSYLINEREANRGKGMGGTGVEVTIPSNIVDLPTTCAIRIVIIYKIVPFKDTVEINKTAKFTLYPEPTESSSTGGPATTRSNQTPGSSASPSIRNRSYSSSKHTTQHPSAQSNSSQQQDNPRNSILGRLFQSIVL